jgi:hypothetical protein
MSVDPATHTPVGQPEVVAADITADDSASMKTPA